jgi:hypothetical protein
MKLVFVEKHLHKFFMHQTWMHDAVRYVLTFHIRNSKPIEIAGKVTNWRLAAELY